MPRTRVQRVGPESVSLQAFGLLCSSCNGLMGSRVRGPREADYFRDYTRLGPIAKLATSYPAPQVPRARLAHASTTHGVASVGSGHEPPLTMLKVGGSRRGGGLCHARCVASVPGAEAARHGAVHARTTR